MLRVYETASCETDVQGVRERRRGEETVGRME